MAEAARNQAATKSGRRICSLQWEKAEIIRLSNPFRRESRGRMAQQRPAQRPTIVWRLRGLLLSDAVVHRRCQGAGAVRAGRSRNLSHRQRETQACSSAPMDFLRPVQGSSIPPEACSSRLSQCRPDSAHKLGCGLRPVFGGFERADQPTADDDAVGDGRFFPHVLRRRNTETQQHRQVGHAL